MIGRKETAGKGPPIDGRAVCRLSGRGRGSRGGCGSISAANSAIAIVEWIIYKWI